MQKTPEAYLKEPYSRILIPNDDGTFSGEVLEFPGCVAEGDTANQAMENLEAAAMSWIEASLEQGLDIPEPSLNQGFGGKVALRLPRSLHRQAARLAERDGVSLNQFLVTAIAARVGAEDFNTRLSEKFEIRFANTAANIVFTVARMTFQRIPEPQSSVSTLSCPEGIVLMNTPVWKKEIAHNA